MKKKAVTKKKKVDTIKLERPAPADFNRLSEGKTINVSDLPECVHKSLLMKIVNDPKLAKICAVAFLNPDRHWEAFAGYPDVRDLKAVLPLDTKNWHPHDIMWLCENVNDVMSVTMMGQKIPKDAAIKLFPDWSIVTYFE